MQINQDRKKTCPNCAKQDITSFSSCRYCGTKYNAIIKRDNPHIDERAICAIALGALLIGAIFYGREYLKSIRAQQLASITKSIQTAHRPRMIEFYATWCGPCKAYGPIIDQCQAKYVGQIDFQRLNIDDPSNADLRRTLGVSAIPATFLFSRKGEEVLAEVGGRDFATLDKQLQDLSK